MSRDCEGGSWHLLSGSGTIEVLAQVSGEIRSIVACTVNEGRFAPSHEWQAHDVHSGCRNNPAIVTDASLAIEHGDVQPGVVGAISRRPNHRTDTSIDQVKAEPGFRSDIRRLKAMRRGKLLRKPARVHPIIDAGEQPVQFQIGQRAVVGKRSRKMNLAITKTDEATHEFDARVAQTIEVDCHALRRSDELER